MSACRRVLVLALSVAVLSLRTASAAPEPRFKLMPLDAGGPIPYFIAEGEDGSRFRPGDSELAAWALQEWERATGGALRFARVEREAAALLRFHWLPFSEDAALGRMEPSMVDGRAVAAINVRPDESWFRPSIRRRVQVDPLMRDVVLYFVCLHEIGHALGLSHSHNPRDVMWPGANGVTLPVYDRYRHRLRNREDIPATSWLSRGDLARFEAVWAAGGRTARTQ